MVAGASDVTRAEAPRPAARRLPPAVVDALLVFSALALGLVELTGTRARTVEGIFFRPADATADVLLLLSTVPLMLRRRWPWSVLLVTTAAACVSQAGAYTRPPLAYGPLIALFTIAARYDVRHNAVAAAIFIGGSGAAAAIHHEPLNDDPIITDVVSVVVVAMLGYSVRLSRIHSALQQEQSQRLRTEQEALTQLALDKELGRIERELHDIVAHHVSVIVAQAGAARRVCDVTPGTARDVLTSIESVGREALTELRRLLSVVWTADGEPDREPPPSLEQLPALVGQVRQAGVPVHLTVNGDVRPLARGAALNAYRIVQEALTNSLKHAKGAPVYVTVTYLSDAVQIDVRDEGPRRDEQVVPGNGLIGIQQRTALMRGSLKVGPGPDGGFDVLAWLPDNAAPS
jgi:signal transduction histidine kinase